MGTFSVTIGVGNLRGGDLTPVSAMVDTGAAHTMVPESLLVRLGIAPMETFDYELADRTIAQYGYGMARIAIDGREWPCPVIFGPEDEHLLGATTLEIFNLTVDPVGQLLLPRRFRARPV